MPTEATPLQQKGEAPAGAASSRLAEGHSSPWHAFTNELKCLIGVGSLTLPYVTMKAGLMTSILGVLFLCYCAWEGIRLLIYCAAMELRTVPISEKQDGSSSSSSSSSRSSEGGGSWRRISEAAFGRTGWYVTFLSLTFAQVGVATSYVDQTSATVQDALGLGRPETLLLLWVLLSMLVMFVSPGMRAVAYFSLIALIVYVYIYSIIVCYFATDGPAAEFVSTSPNLVDLTKLNIWYGPALFAFEGMGTALAVYESLGKRDPTTFLSICSVSYALAGVVYCSVMTIGYLYASAIHPTRGLMANPPALLPLSLPLSLPFVVCSPRRSLDRHRPVRRLYGSATPTMLLDAFPQTPVAESARLILAVALTCSFVLQMTPVFQACESLLPPAWRYHPTLPAWIPTRVLLVGCTVLLSSLIPSVEQARAISPYLTPSHAFVIHLSSTCKIYTHLCPRRLLLLPFHIVLTPSTRLLPPRTFSHPPSFAVPCTRADDRPHRRALLLRPLLRPARRLLPAPRAAGHTVPHVREGSRDDAHSPRGRRRHHWRAGGDRQGVGSDKIVALL